MKNEKFCQILNEAFGFDFNILFVRVELRSKIGIVRDKF